MCVGTGEWLCGDESMCILQLVCEGGDVWACGCACMGGGEDYCV